MHIAIKARMGLLLFFYAAFAYHNWVKKIVQSQMFNYVPCNLKKMTENYWKLSSSEHFKIGHLCSEWGIFDKAICFYGWTSWSEFFNNSWRSSLAFLSRILYEILTVNKCKFFLSAKADGLGILVYTD